MSSSAITRALACESATPQTDGNERNSGSTMWAMVGSPSQPSARLVSVIPTWVVAMVWLRFSIACRTATAPKRPSSTRASTRVQRTVTSANSAETKKALRAIMTNTPTTRTPSRSENDMGGPGLREVGYSTSRRPSSARASVTWSEYSRSEPIGTPRAMRVTRTPSGASRRDR